MLSVSALLQKQEPIAPPVNRQVLEDDIKRGELLGKTADNKYIYLYTTKVLSPALLEIGTLREVTFRCVSEGTGKSYDVGEYDFYYDHLILWDDREKEIVGSYRLVPCQRAIDDNPDNPTPLYTQGLFNFTEDFKETYFPLGVEMGRSFVQPKYWGTRSLDYLWFGIAAYFVKYPHLRYFIGAVSISKDYPTVAKNLLVHFYGKYFGGKNELASAQHPFEVSKTEIGDFADELDKEIDYRDRFIILKKKLTMLGVSVPALYKQYTEMYEEGGVNFLSFTVNRGFGDAIDGLIIADVTKIKESRKNRYIAGPR